MLLFCFGLVWVVVPYVAHVHCLLVCASLYCLLSDCVLLFFVSLVFACLWIRFFTCFVSVLLVCRLHRSIPNSYVSLKCELLRVGTPESSAICFTQHCHRTAPILAIQDNRYPPLLHLKQQLVCAPSAPEVCKNEMYW